MVSIEEAFIAGTSAHNQCIERLWGEVIRCVVRHFRYMFFFLENEGSTKWSPCICITYIYMQRIAKTLKEFSNDWRYRLLPSERNHSPYQFWHYGMTRLIHLDPASAKLLELLTGVSMVLTREHLLLKLILQIMLKYLNRGSLYATLTWKN